MAKSRVKFRNLDRLKRRIRRLSPEITDAVAKATLTSAVDYENTVKQEIRLSPASGAVYGKHIASSPGRAPRVNTGDHINAIKTKQSKLSKTLVSVGIHAGERDRKGQSLGARAYFLEMGTSRMDARPVFTPVLKRKQKDIKRRIRAALRDAVKKARTSS